MTYKVIKVVDVNCKDHGFSWDETLKEGFKTIFSAEIYLRMKFYGKKSKDGLNKLFHERHANKVVETYVVCDNNNVPANGNYWARIIRQSKND